MKTEKPMSNAKIMLSNGLHEAWRQMEKSDIGELATELVKTEKTVREYLKGDVANMETGQAILKAARALIIKREKAVKNLVAA